MQAFSGLQPLLDIHSLLQRLGTGCGSKLPCRSREVSIGSLSSCIEPFGSKKKAPESVGFSRLGVLHVLVPEIGIEPTIYALRMRRSTN
jgi:hypothetical protein